MKHRRILFYFLISICLFSCTNGQSHEAVVSQNAAQWKDDLNYLAAQLPRLHKNAFHTLSKETFQEQVTILSRKIDSLTDDQIIVELVRIVALLGDGHTHLDLPTGLNRYPLEIAQFADEFRIIVTHDQHAEILGSRLIAIENLPIDTIHKRLIKLVPHGENMDRTSFTSLQFLGSPEILHGLNIIKNKDEALFTFQNNLGEI